MNQWPVSGNGDEILSVLFWVDAMMSSHLVDRDGGLGYPVRDARATRPIG